MIPSFYADFALAYRFRNIATEGVQFSAVPDICDRTCACSNGPSPPTLLYMITNIIVAVLLIQQLSFASADAEGPRIGFSFVHESLMVVPVFLNGRGPYRFLFDTGATNTILSNRVADQLNIPVGKTQTLLTVGGTAVATKRIIDVIRIGNTQITQLPIVAADLKLMRTLHVDGIIGGDCLKQFRISIDYAHQLITIEP